MKKSTKGLIILLIIVVAAVAFIAGASIFNPDYGADIQTFTSLPGSKVIALSLVTLNEQATTSPHVSVEFPQFPGLPSELNKAMSSTTREHLADFRVAMTENDAARRATGGDDDAISPDSYSFIADWEPDQVNSRYISLVLRFSSYAGGANENDQLETFNYDVVHRHFITLADIFPGVPNLMQKISDVARSQLSDSLTTASPGYIPGDMLVQGTAPAALNFSRFTFTDYLVTIYFPKYAVAPGAFGEQKVVIPRNAFK